MLSHQKYICCTVLKLQLHRLLVLGILSCGSALFCWTQYSVAQDDIKFREFDSKRVHSPRELARDLNYLFFKDKQNPLADIDPEKLKKLKELGDDFFENLSDEEKKQAQDFADKFMRDKGLSSPEGKLLMDQLGVSPEMQSELAKEFGDNNPADFERFRDLFKNSDRPSGIGQNGSHNSEVPQRGKLSKIPKGEVGKERSEDFRGQGGQPKTGSKTGSKTASQDRPKDLFETLPNELGNKSSARRKGLPDDLAKRKSASDLDKQFSDAAKANADRNGSRFPGEDTNPDGSFGRGSSNGAPGSRNGNGSGGIGDSVEGKNSTDRIADGKDAASKNPKRGQGALKGQSKDGAKQGVAGKVDGKSLADQDRELGKELLELLKDREFESTSREGKTGESKAGKSVSGSAKAVQKRPKTGSGMGGVDGQSSPELDETFKSWIQMEAIKKGIREFRERGGPADFQRRSLESAFKKGFKGIGESIGKRNGNGKSESDFAEKLDRVLFEAAQDSVQAGADPDVDSDGVGGSVENAIDGLLGHVSEAVKKRREEKRKRQHERMIKSQTNELSQIPLNSDQPFQSENSPGSNAFEYGTGALSATAEMLEGIPELPAFGSRKLLTYLVIAAVSILLICLLLRRFSNGKSSPAAQKFGRSFRGAKIHSPKDLVEAVDYFIVQKFGGRSQWWNAKHAQDMLCAGAPGYSAKISELLKDYVRARYTRADVTLSPEEQLSYKKTLQELAKEVPSETPADASQNEG